MNYGAYLPSPMQIDPLNPSFAGRNCPKIDNRRHTFWKPDKLPEGMTVCFDLLHYTL